MLNNKEYLNKLYQSDKPLIIYKTDKGYDIYTDFSRRIIINKKNLKYFLNIQSKSKKSKIEELNDAKNKIEQELNSKIEDKESQLVNE